MKENVTPINLTDGQWAASLQSENQMLRTEMARQKHQLEESAVTHAREVQKLTAHLREIQAQLLASQDRVTVLQGKLLVMRTVVNEP